MVDTVRTFSELQDTLFADGQAAGSITPQDLRDLILTLRQPYGSWTSSTALATPIATPGTYQDINLTSTPFNVRDMSADTTGHLTYNGTVNRHFHVAVSISFTCATNNQTVGFTVARNEIVLPESEIRRKVGTGADVGAVAVHCDMMMSPGDNLSLHATNFDSTSSITVSHCYFFAMGMHY